MYSRIFKRSYPIQIILDSQAGKLNFEVFSPVEKFRISEYGSEKEFLDYFISHIRSDDIIYDIGASVGLFTVFSGSKAIQGKVFAFEPDPETLDRLKNNVKLNNLSNIIYIPWAVSDTRGETILYTDGASGFAPSLADKKGHIGAPKGKVKINTRTIDDAISDGTLSLPSVIKIDIEGAECLCLRGSSKLLNGEFKSIPRLIFLEAHPEFLASYNCSINQLLSLIPNSKYQLLQEIQRGEQIHYIFERKDFK